jgi:formylglycine-generating enzyme required for sulfatase activity
MEMDWVTIPAGDFLMGAQRKDPLGQNYDFDAWSDESPVHEVHLSAYRIGRYPVTVAEYKRFMDEGGYKWHKRKEYWEAGGCGWWAAPADWDEQLGHPKRPVVYVSWYEAAAYAAWAGFRLPTEAEWERAARGTEPDGILDMVGNGWDWCWDWFDDYSSNAQVDPRGPSKGDSRVLRGGSWYKNETCLRSTYRSWQRPDYRDNHIRFRVASTV